MRGAVLLRGLADAPAAQGLLFQAINYAGASRR